MRSLFFAARCLALGSLLLFAAAASSGESALARSHSDPALQWGPCPGFFPPGCQIAVLHGDPDRPNADVFFRVPGRYDLPRHWHGSAERMVLVTGELEVRYDGQEPVLLQPGMYAYGPPRAPHAGRCRGAEPCVLFIAFEGPVDAHAGTPTAAPTPMDLLVR